MSGYLRRFSFLKSQEEAKKKQIKKASQPKIEKPVNLDSKDKD